MKIIIVGCGKIGITIIESLVSEGHDVVAVDANKSAVEEVGNIYDVMCLCGNGVDCETLSEAGVEKSRALRCGYGVGRVQYAELLYCPKNGRQTHPCPHQKSRI